MVNSNAHTTAKVAKLLLLMHASNSEVARETRGPGSIEWSAQGVVMISADTGWKWPEHISAQQVLSSTASRIEVNIENVRDEA